MPSAATSASTGADQCIDDASFTVVNFEFDEVAVIRERRPPIDTISGRHAPHRRAS